MKVLKARCESEELLTFRSLNLRMELTASDRSYYYNLEKGYEGELAFDRLCEAHLSDDWLAVLEVSQNSEGCLVALDFPSRLNPALCLLAPIFTSTKLLWIYPLFFLPSSIVS